jgi:hypothetical protein
MPKQDDRSLEQIPSEIADQDVNPVSYDIVTYPADYTLEGLVGKLNKTVLIPGFQRKYVWTIKQASRLIESFLLGLPVPAIFLYADPETNKYLVVDGQQRLLSIAYYFEGYFGVPDRKGNRVVFRLEGLNEKSPYNRLTYQEIKSKDEPAFSRLNESVLRAFVVKQLRPEGQSSIYHIFERLNTGGTQLAGQEIRNCIYHGDFNTTLISLNKTKEWRAVFGTKTEDKRLRDVELILRFFALHHEGTGYFKPMKEFLSRFMEKHREDDRSKLLAYEEMFKRTTSAVHEHLGPRPFHIHAGLNVAAYDAVYVAFARNLDNIRGNVSSRYASLKKQERFQELVSSATTDEKVVADRLKLVEKKLFG